MKLDRIRSEQLQGHMIAMVGDGTNDARLMLASVRSGTMPFAASSAG